MPKLQNARHEAFARNLAKGRSMSQSYILAGYADDHGHASRLLASNGDIAVRVNELKAAAARRAEVSIEYVLTRLKRLVKSPDEKVQVKALELIAKHLGAFEHVRRVEHSGTVKTQQVDLAELSPEKFAQLRDILMEAHAKSN